LFGKPNPEFQKIASKNVHFMPFVPPDEIPSILQQADILINPSDQDSSFKFFEYIRAGRPILGFKGRPSYIFDHMENAYLTNDFKDGIKKLVENSLLREKISKNIKKLRKGYTLTWKEVAQKHLEFYKIVLKKQNATILK
jgi:glycosyltransferase involved in cell wall biosynthesis